MVVVLMRLLTKSYPSLMDVYERTEEFNDETGGVVYDWDYNNPVTMPCNITSLSPDNSLEQFGEFYTKKIFVKVEYPKNDIFLSNQAGNLRSRDESYRYYVLNESPPGTVIFNVSGINTQIDVLGNLVCYVAYLEYTRTISGIAQ